MADFVSKDIHTKVDGNQKKHTENVKKVNEHLQHPIPNEQCNLIHYYKYQKNKTHPPKNDGWSKHEQKEFVFYEPMPTDPYRQCSSSV